jgi:hypothetical protein
MILGLRWPSRNGNGVIEDLGFLVHESEEDYRAKSDEYVDGEHLGNFRENAFLFRKRQRGLAPRRERSDDVVDRAAMSRVLRGREHYASAFAIGGPINPRTGEPYSRYSTEFEQWATSHGKPVLTTEQASAIEHIDFGVRAHDAARALLSNGMALGVVRGDYCGVPCQARVDWLNPRRGIVALVPCSDLSNAEWTIRRQGPTHELAFRHGLIAAVTGHDVPAHIIAVETREPHRCGVWIVSKGVLSKVRKENEKALRQLAECHRLDRWPTGYETVRVLAPTGF